jgi:hypothetical protein
MLGTFSPNCLAVFPDMWRCSYLGWKVSHVCSSLYTMQQIHIRVCVCFRFCITIGRKTPYLGKDKHGYSRDSPQQRVAQPPALLLSTTMRIHDSWRKSWRKLCLNVQSLNIQTPGATEVAIHSKYTPLHEHSDVHNQRDSPDHLLTLWLLNPRIVVSKTHKFAPKHLSTDTQRSCTQPNCETTSIEDRIRRQHSCRYDPPQLAVCSSRNTHKASTTWAQGRARYWAFWRTKWAL